MLSISIEFAVSALLICTAGLFLTRSADEIARITGLGRLLAGAILLSAATSLPDLAVDLNSVLLGRPDLALGDLTGGCVYNLLALALADFAYRRGHLISRLTLAHALPAAVSVALVALAGMAILAHTPNKFAGLGPFSWAILIVYVLGIRIVFKDQNTNSHKSTPPPAEPAPPKSRRLLRPLIVFVLSSIAIVLASRYLATSADQIAVRAGLSHSFVGATLIGFVNALPELATSIVAIKMDAYDLALGNIFGSNAMNMALIVPLDLASPTSLLASVNPVHALTCFGVILVTSIVIIGQLYSHASSRFFLKPDALLILLLSIGVFVLIFMSQ